MKVVAEDTENDKFFPERRYGDNDAKINSDDVADGDDGPPDNVADGDDDVADNVADGDDGSPDNVADGDDDVADEDDEEEDDVADDDEEENEDDENDEELTYHYIVYDQDPNNDEQIKEFYASDEIPDEVIEKIIADDYEEY